MLSVLKQEFSIHKKNILFTSIIITAIYAISLICLCLNNVITSENMADFTAIWLAIGLIVGSVGAFFITLTNMLIILKIVRWCLSRFYII